MILIFAAGLQLIFGAEKSFKIQYAISLERTYAMQQR
jgi:hypothetical protein